jgi:NAD dependent epimerase/dehydratase family enzyme
MAADRIAVVAGANGFVGRALVHALERDGYAVRTIGRHVADGGDDAGWDDPAGIAEVVDGSELVVNLAGKSVNCRYTDANREEVLRSRTATTRALREAIASSARPPRVWMNASTATIYRHAMDRPQTESTGALGSGFSVDVARSWEREFFADELPGTRRVALRMAIVPATSMLLTLARIGLGGPQIDGPWFPHRRYRGIGEHPTGTGRAPSHRTRGRQRFSWIHLDDVISAIRFLRDRDDIDGVVNLASPNPSDNRTLMATLRRVVGMPFGLPAWRFMLEPAMWALRTEPELVLKSRWVVPERLLAEGFSFSQPSLAGALRDIADR